MNIGPLVLVIFPNLSTCAYYLEFTVHTHNYIHTHNTVLQPFCEHNGAEVLLQEHSMHGFTIARWANYL